MALRCGWTVRSLEGGWVWSVSLNMGKLYQLLVIAGFILGCHLIVRIFLRFVHVRPFGANMPHDFVWRPFWVQLLQLLPVVLAEVNVSWERLLGSWGFSFCSHIWTHRLIIIGSWGRILLSTAMRINLSWFERCSLSDYSEWNYFLTFIRSFSLL